MYREAARVLAGTSECPEGHRGVCIPVHTHLHWVLVVLSLQDATFTVYDSLARSILDPKIHEAIGAIRTRLDDHALTQGSAIQWGPTVSVQATALAQQFDMDDPCMSGGDCMLFVA